MRQQFRDCPVKWKLVLEISLLVAAISVFLLLYFPQRQKQIAMRGLENKAISLAEMIAYSASAGLEFENVSSVENVFISMQGDPDLRHVQVVRSDGSPFSLLPSHPTLTNMRTDQFPLRFRVARWFPTQMGC